jgi:MYXO-CTERM domain-containing protein
MFGDSGARPTARLWRRTGVAGLMICAVMGVAGPAAAAPQQAEPNPSELWKAYPLEQKPSTVATSPTPGGSSPRGDTAATSRTSASSVGESGGGVPVALIYVIGLAAALSVLAAVAIRRRHAAAAPPVAEPRVQRLRAEPPTAPVAARPAAAPRAAPVRNAPRTSPVATAPPQRAVELVDPTPPPRRTSPNGRAAAARKTPICQVRWSRRGRSFYAVLVGGDGVEHWLAGSPRLNNAGPAPPEETPEARAALRRLAKQLREQGWRPLRAKGVDFDERRWYARRFRRPTEAELTEAAAAHDASIVDRSAGRR